MLEVLDVRKEANTISVVVTQKVTAQEVCDQFCAAFEGGSNYWLHQADLVESEVPENEGVVFWGSANIYRPGLKIRVLYDDPEQDEGNGAGKKTITWTDIVNGLQIMADKHPEHFADIIKESGDAITADVMMQCIVLGEVVYG